MPDLELEDAVRATIRRYIEENNLPVIDIEQHDEEDGSRFETIEIAPDYIGHWAIVDGSFLSYFLSHGFVHRLRQEGFEEDQIEGEKIYLKIRDLDAFLYLLTPKTS